MADQPITLNLTLSGEDMPKKNRGVQLLLLVAIAGGVVWKSAGYYATDVDAANAGAKAVTNGKAFARKVLPT